jgi:hypothetical protein
MMPQRFCAYALYVYLFLLRWWLLVSSASDTRESECRRKHLIFADAREPMQRHFSMPLRDMPCRFADLSIFYEIDEQRQSFLRERFMRAAIRRDATAAPRPIHTVTIRHACHYSPIHH